MKPRKFSRRFTRAARPRGTAIERRVSRPAYTFLCELVADAERGIEFFLERRPWLKAQEQWRQARARSNDFIFAKLSPGGR